MPFSPAVEFIRAEARRRNDRQIVARSSIADFPTGHGLFKIQSIRDREKREHLLVMKGDVAGASHVPVRVHSECLTGEALRSMRCDCNAQLHAALDFFESAGIGLLIYLRQEGRGTGLFNKIEAYALQDSGFDTVDASTALGLPVDARTYEVAVEVLQQLGVRSVRLLTNNPAKINALQAHGIDVAERVPIHVESNAHNDAYMRTKWCKMEHLL